MFDCEVNMGTNITINERISDLRVMSGLSQKELAERIDIPTSTLSRIEQGKISNVSNDVLIKIADFFNVSADYLLGLTDVKFKKNVELAELGLSNKALFILLSGKVNGNLLSRLIEHPHFPMLLDTADAYFKDAHKAGIQSRNDVINLATASIKDFIKDNPEKRMEAGQDIRALNAAKIGGDEADLNKLRNIFMSILKDIKEDYNDEPHEDISQTEFQDMLSEIKTQADTLQEEHNINEDDMASIVTSVLSGSGVADFDETELLMFYELFKHIIERMSGESD
jgi:transcriptional regulator with XRE-family HTH domain